MIQANRSARPGAAPPPKDRCGSFTFGIIPFFGAATGIIALNISTPLPPRNADLGDKPRLFKLSKARPQLRFAPLPTMRALPPLHALLQPRRHTKGAQ